MKFRSLHTAVRMATVASMAPAVAVITCALCVGCAAHAPRANSFTTTDLAPLTQPLDADAAAARALAVSPKVRAASLRLDAAAARAHAVTLPPDPRIALELGIPIDGLSGTALGASLTQGITWLFTKDALIDAASREREALARELVATSAATIAEARRLVRVVNASRNASAAARDALSAAHELETLERARVTAGESTEAAAAQRSVDAFVMANDVLERELAEHDASVALASLLAVDVVPELVMHEQRPLAGERHEPLEVVRARYQVALARAQLTQLDNPLGNDAMVGGGYMRDLEDRQAALVTVDFTLPLFRRHDQVTAAQAECDAALAELAEASRVAELDNVHALARLNAAVSGVESAHNAVIRAQRVRDITLASHAQGEANQELVAQMQLLECAARVRAAQQEISLAEAIFTLDTRIASAPMSAAMSARLSDADDPHSVAHDASPDLALNASNMQQGAPR